MKLTPWFPNDTHPVRKGYYDTRVMSDASVRFLNKIGGYGHRRVEAAIIRLFWTGCYWTASKNSPSYSHAYWRQNRAWRGVFA